MRILVTLVLLFLAGFGGDFFATQVRAQAQPGATKAASAEEAAFVAKLAKLWEQYNASYRKEDLAQADQTIGEILGLVRQRFGNQHDSVALALDTQAQIKAHLGDAAAAKRGCDEQIAILTAMYGANHWRTTTAKCRDLQFVKLGQLSAEDRKRIRGTNSIASAAQQLVSKAALVKAEYAKALPLYESVLATRRELLGDEHLVVALSLREMATCAAAAGNRERAEAALRESVSIFERLVGKRHPETALSRIQLALTVQFTERYEEAEPLFLEVLDVRKELLGAEHQQTLVAMENLGNLYDAMKAARKAEQIRVQELAGQRKALGEEHQSTAQTMSKLASTYRELGEHQKAEEQYVRCLEIRRKVLGSDHEATLATLADLASHYETRVAFAKAEPLRMEHLASTQRLHGDEHVKTAASLNASGFLQSNLGHYPRAVELLTKAVTVRQKLLGSGTHETLDSQSKLAGAYGNMGQNAAQERLLVACLAGYRKLYGDEHLATATTLRELAHVYSAGKEYAKAESMHTQSLAIVRKLEKEPKGNTVSGLCLLGSNHLMLGKYGEAEKLLLESLEVCRKWHGHESPLIGIIEIFLATTYQLQGKLPEAEAVYRRSLEACARTLGKEHPLITIVRYTLATVLYQRQKYDEAFAELRGAVGRAEHEFQELGNVVSEDESIALAAKYGGYIEAAIEFTSGNDRYASDVYQDVLKYKGQILVRQRLLRAVADSPALRDVWRDLADTAADLAAQSRHQPTVNETPAWQARIEQLSEKVTRLNTQLVQSSTKFRAARAPVTVDQITAALPEGAVLVDFAEYNYASFPNPGEEKPLTPEKRLAAFILRPAVPLRFVNLGPVKPLQAAIDAWRSDLGGKVSSAGLQAASELRERLWLPIEKHLVGAKLVLVSPDGALARLPLGALPGKSPGSYLLEDWTISLIPSAQAIPELLQQEQPAARLEGNLLLVGGVDYEGRPGTKRPEQPQPYHDFLSFAGPRGDGKLTFPPLEGTKDEVVAIERSYTDLVDRARRGVMLLEGTDASKEAFRRLAPRYAYLHVATHGFFAPPEFKSALQRPAHSQVQLIGEFVTNQSIAGLHPGLLSGLALAGAGNSSREGNDGILTAQEVSTLDLRGVKLVVLSACETGLGEVAGGEGLLGLQRSFQAAGARTVIATLWKVDDLVTRDLMKRFYENLWSKRLNKVEALREAQLWLLKERGPRGLTEVDEATKETNRLPPYYWAAFTLSGDWR